MTEKPDLAAFAAHITGKPLTDAQRKVLAAIGARVHAAHIAADAPAFEAGLGDPATLRAKVDAHLVGKGGTAYVWDPAMDPTPRPDHYKSPDDYGRAMGVDLASGNDVSVVALMKGREITFLQVGQSMGQLAQIMENVQGEIAKAFRVPPLMLRESAPCVGHSRPLRPRTATEQAQIEHRPRFSYHDTGPAMDVARWSDSGSDPLAAFKAWQDRMMNEWRTLAGFAPNRVIMPLRNWFIVHRRVRGKPVTKRAWRRYRGRAKGQRRAGL